MKKLLLFCAVALLSLSASAFNISYNLTGCTADAGNVTEVSAEDYEADLYFDLTDGYTWTGATVSVTMGGEPMMELMDYMISNSLGMEEITDEEQFEIYIFPSEEFSGDIEVTLTAVEKTSGSAVWGETLENGVLSIAPANKSVTYLPCVMDADWYNSYMEEMTEEEIYDEMILMMYTSDMLLSGDKSGADLADYTSYANLTAAGDHYLFIAECTADPEDNEYIVRTGALSVIKLTVAGIKLPATFTAANFEDIEIGASGVYRPADFAATTQNVIKENYWLSGGAAFSTTNTLSYGYYTYSGIQAVNFTEASSDYSDAYLLSANNAAAEGSNYGVFNATYDPMTWSARSYESVKLSATRLSGLAVNNIAHTVGSVTVGDGYARPLFTEGDYFTLTIQALRGGNLQGTVTVDLAKYDDETGELNVVEDWMWVDLMDIDATVDELRFSVDGSDAGLWGLNTPAYFCMDNIGGMQSACTLGKKTAYRELALTEGYASMCWDKNWTVEGAKVYTAQYNAAANLIDLYEVSGTVPAGAGVIVYAEGKEKVLLRQSHDEVAPLAYNSLVGVNEETAVSSLGLNNIYALGLASGDVAFCKYNGANVPAHRAVLGLPTAPSNVRMRIVNATTDLENVESVRAIKHIENGQLFIERDGVRYNVMGIQF